MSFPCLPCQSRTPTEAWAPTSAPWSSLGRQSDFPAVNGCILLFQDLGDCLWGLTGRQTRARPEGPWVKGKRSGKRVPGHQILQVHRRRGPVALALGSVTQGQVRTSSLLAWLPHHPPKSHHLLTESVCFWWVEEDMSRVLACATS